MNTSTLGIRGGDPVRKAPFITWPPISESTVRAVADAVREGIWSDVAGPRKLEFERQFAAFQGTDFALAVSNGTVSLQIAMAALDIQSGDEVIVPAYTFLATATSVLAVNAMPVFVDVLPGTATIDPDAVEAAITSRTKAIIPVHFAGQPADMDALIAISARTGIPIIEDAAQAHGAQWRGQGVGSFGTFGSFSFQASKNMTSGEGGALTTNDAVLADRAWSLHHCGRVRGEKWYNHELNGGNHRLSELQCALLLDQLTRVEDYMSRRTRGAATLDSALDGIAGLTPLTVDSRVSRHAYHVYCFRYDASAFSGIDRGLFLEAMQSEGIPASGGYIAPLNRQPVFANHVFDVAALRNNPSDPRFAYGDIRLPVSEELCSTMVFVPQNVLLGTDEDVLTVAEAASKIQRLAGALR